MASPRLCARASVIQVCSTYPSARIPGCRFQAGGAAVVLEKSPGFYLCGNKFSFISIQLFTASMLYFQSERGCGMTKADLVVEVMRLGDLTRAGAEKIVETISIQSSEHCAPETRSKLAASEASAPANANPALVSTRKPARVWKYPPSVFPTSNQVKISAIW